MPNLYGTTVSFLYHQNVRGRINGQSQEGLSQRVDDQDGDGGQHGYGSRGPPQDGDELK